MSLIDTLNKIETLLALELEPNSPPIVMHFHPQTYQRLTFELLRIQRIQGSSNAIFHELRVGSLIIRNSEDKKLQDILLEEQHKNMVKALSVAVAQIKEEFKRQNRSILYKVTKIFRGKMSSFGKYGRRKRRHYDFRLFTTYFHGKLNHGNILNHETHNYKNEKGEDIIAYTFNVQVPNRNRGTMGVIYND